jgi:hypothetical protein
MMTAAILLLVAGSTAAAKCCSAGGRGGASYDFLGDSSMDINMDSYEQFLRDDVAESSVTALQTANAVSDSKNRLELNLSDSSHIDLHLSGAKDSLTGTGNLTGTSATVPVEALGQLLEKALTLNVTDIDGDIYRFNLEREDNSVSGYFSLIKPDKTHRNGTAEGWLT